MKNVSTQSKRFKSNQWKQEKRAKNEENRRHRAALHSQKSLAGNVGKRAEIQAKIDLISRGVLSA